MNSEFQTLTSGEEDILKGIDDSNISFVQCATHTFGLICCQGCLILGLHVLFNERAEECFDVTLARSNIFKNKK